MARDILLTAVNLLFLLWFKLRAAPSWGKD